MIEDAVAELVAEIKGNAGKYYVYILGYPDGTPFYVGCGKAGQYHPRILDHERLAFSSCRYRRSFKSSIIRKIIVGGAQVVKAIDSWHLDPSAMFEREMALIASIGRRDQNRGPLANGNDGGTGQTSSTPEARAKMAAGLAAWWTDERRETAREVARQRFFSEEARAKLRAILASPEWRATQSRRMKAAHADPVKRKRLRDPLNVVLRSPEHRRLRSELMKAHFSTAEARELASRKQKEVWENPVYREKGRANLRNMTLRRWSLPGAKERASQKIRAAWTPARRAASAERMKKMRAAQTATRKAN